MEVLLMIGMGCINILCFLVGANVGMKVSKDEPIELPEVNPVKAWNDHQERKVARQEKNKMDVIYENIENYDGTSAGQRDIPM